MGKLLRNQGYEVVLAGNIIEAVRACNELPFDVCIVDIDLRDRTGCELMCELRARHKIKAIASSGYDYDSECVQATEAGFEHYLVNPIDFKVLLPKVEEVLTGSQAPAEAAAV